MKWFQINEAKLSSSGETRIRTWSSQEPILHEPDVMPPHKLPELLKIEQNSNFIARPYDERAFSWLHCAWTIPMMSEHSAVFTALEPSLWWASIQLYSLHLNRPYDERAFSCFHWTWTVPMMSEHSAVFTALEPSLWWASIQLYSLHLNCPYDERAFSCIHCTWTVPMTSKYSAVFTALEPSLWWASIQLYSLHLNRPYDERAFSSIHCTWTVPMMSEHSADFTALDPHWFTPGSGKIHICFSIFMHWHNQVILNQNNKFKSSWRIQK